MLKAMYEKTWDAIVGNCSIFNYLGTNDTESKEYLSKRLRKTTVRVDTRSYNRGKGGGGSDSENYIQRDLLSPDEIPRAVMPKGRTKRYGGSCIVIVDEFKPMYFPKYDTKSHKLFPVTGSSFPNGIPNNTYIEKTYAENKAKRHEKHKQTLTNFFAAENDRKEQADAEYQAEKAAAEEAEQERLSEMFPPDEFEDDDQEKTFEDNMSEDVNPIMGTFDITDDGDDE